ncbi:MAG: dihydrofolate reductase family protein [Aulosira sp. ZfuVER01]|nr:dihydrofolate reductase family protein [Aulosira sp. ZfuVER01]MDZ8001834.1 dihydrofolate reductase family protein [Aulosira sp. DedVER01a]MDZ8053309.1 dihydrofolate reductase family protein [Aulosira sp. ZfuCHP01]
MLGFGEYPYKGKKGFVFSNTLQGKTDNNVEFVGGGQIIHDFMIHSLIDELILSIHPIILEDGIPLILKDPNIETILELKDVKTYDSGLLQVSYDFKRKIADAS